MIPLDFLTSACSPSPARASSASPGVVPLRSGTLTSTSRRTRSATLAGTESRRPATTSTMFVPGSRSTVALKRPPRTGARRPSTVTEVPGGSTVPLTSTDDSCVRAWSEGESIDSRTGGPGLSLSDPHPATSSAHTAAGARNGFMTAEYDPDGSGRIPGMRLRVLFSLLLTAFALVAAGCDSQQRDLIARALDHPVTDGKIAMVATVTQGGSEFVRISAAGPIHSNGPDRLESFDLAVRFGVKVLGSDHGLAFRAISTGDDVFVRYGGTTYEVGKEKVAELNRRAARRAGKLGNPRSLGDFQRLGLDLDSWFPDSKIVGDETLDGEEVTHLQGAIDVAAVVRDVTHLMAQRSLRAGPHAPRLTPAMVDQIEKSITDPTFDVFVDKASGGFRRIAVKMGLDLPKAPHLGLGMRFDYLDAGREQTIAAPSGGRPIRELLERLGRKYGIDLGQALDEGQAGSSS